MAASVYVESSVISYLVARPSRDVIVAARQAITVEWWAARHAYEIFISSLVEEEVSSGDPDAARARLAAVAEVRRLQVTREAQVIARRLVADGAVPPQSGDDALHIGIAAAQGVDYLLTWNFRHINNAEQEVGIVRSIEALGFVCPVLCSPEELGGRT